MLVYNETFDIIFFTIDILDKNSIDTATNIRLYDRKVLFIFITSLEKKIDEFIHLHFLGFMKADYNTDDINTMFDSLISVLNYSPNEYLFNLRNSFTYIKLSDITYYEILNRQVLIHTKREIFVSNYHTLSEIPFDPKSNNFYEIYRGVIVNLSHVKDLQNNKITLTNNECVYVSRRRLKKIKYEYYSQLNRK